MNIYVKRWIPFKLSYKYKDLGIVIYENRNKLYFNAFKKEIIDNNIKINGYEHQYSKNGVPLFSDNCIATFSQRRWGAIMAMIWSEIENNNYTYLDFYINDEENR